MKLATLAHVAAVLRGGPNKLKAMYRKSPTDETPTANGTENGVHPVPETEPMPANGSADKGKAKEPAEATVAPPASVPVTPVVAHEPATPKKGKAGRRSVTDPGSSPGASSSRTALPPVSATRPISPNASTAIVSSSGQSPQTHPALLPPAPPVVASASTSADKDTATSAQDGIERRAIIEQREVFICDAAGGVNSQRLLTLTRRELLSRGESYGANALIDEHWTVSIARSKRMSIGGRTPRTRVTVRPPFIPRIPFPVVPHLHLGTILFL